MKRYDFCFFERSHARFSGEVRIGDTTVVSFICEEDSYSFENKSLRIEPLDSSEYYAITGRLRILADYHFGRNYLWVDAQSYEKEN
jgi:hypothetical protein